MANAQLPGAVLGKERSELGGIQVVSVVGECAVFGAGDRLRGQPLIAQSTLRRDEIAESLAPSLAHPMGYEVELGKALRKHQRMIIRIVRCPGGPSCELASLLESGVTLPEKLRLGHAHLLQRCAHRRPRALANADDPDVRRFDQRHGEAARLHPGLMTGGYDPRSEPPGGSSADDDDRFDRFCHATV